MTIDDATLSDRDRIRALYLEAFDPSEREAVAKLAVELLMLGEEAGLVHLRAEEAGELVGHVCFSPVTRKATGEPLGVLLAPLAVASAWQGRGIGSALVREGLQRVRGQGEALVYGDPGYYGRFGFSADAAQSYLPPYPLMYPSGWLAMGGEAVAAVGQPIRIQCVAPLCVAELW